MITMPAKEKQEICCQCSKTKLPKFEFKLLIQQPATFLKFPGILTLPQQLVTFLKFPGKFPCIVTTFITLS
jgi:hypothetical protein